MTRHELAAMLYAQHNVGSKHEELAREVAIDCLKSAEFFFEELDKYCPHSYVNGNLCNFCGLRISTY